MRKILFNFTLVLFIFCQFSFAQKAPKPDTTIVTPAGTFTVGERLTYNISFANFTAGAYAETLVVSQGKYGDRDAVYLQGKVKSTDVLNAALFNVNETRQTLISTDTGMPLYSKTVFDESGNPREKITDYKGAAAGFDILSAIFHLRFSNLTTGSIAFQEGDEVFQGTYKVIGKIRHKTPAGEFDTVTYAIKNSYLPDLQIHFTNDEQRLPVVITYKHSRGQFRAELASIQNVVPEPVAAETPRPTPTPIVVSTPRPRPTPTPHINNQPLSADLPFQLGETLNYKISRPNTALPFGVMSVQAKERRQYNGKDSLLLVTSVGQITEPNSFFTTGDSIKSYVDPESLLPIRTEIVFRGTLSQFNQTLLFDQATGKVSDARATTTDVPVGTHDILSLAYAVRSFNLRDAKPNQGPGADTRVAIYTVDGPLILTILPQPEEIIDYLGQKIATQVIFTNIGQTTVKLWLSKEPGRLPLRLSVASPTFAFTADLTSVTQMPPIVESITGPAVSTPGTIQGIPGIPASAVRPNTPDPTLNAVPSNVDPTRDPNIKMLNTTNPTLVNPTVANPTPTPGIKRP